MIALRRFLQRRRLGCRCETPEEMHVRIKNDLFGSDEKIEGYKRRFQRLLYDQFVLSTACMLPFLREDSNVIRSYHAVYPGELVFSHFRPGRMYVNTAASVINHALGAYAQNLSHRHQSEHVIALSALCASKLTKWTEKSSIAEEEVFRVLDPLAKSIDERPIKEEKHMGQLYFMQDVHELFHVLGLALIRHSFINRKIIQKPARGSIAITDLAGSNVLDPTSRILTGLYNGDRGLHAEDCQHFQSIHHAAYKSVFDDLYLKSRFDVKIE